MHKPLTWILSCLAGLLLTGIAPAQDTTATKPSKPATSSAQSKTSTAAKKPGTTAAKPAAPGAALTTAKQKASYALGMNVGTGMCCGKHRTARTPLDKWIVQLPGD